MKRGEKSSKECDESVRGASDSLLNHGWLTESSDLCDAGQRLKEIHTFGERRERSKVQPVAETYRCERGGQEE